MVSSKHSHFCLIVNDDEVGTTKRAFFFVSTFIEWSSAEANCTYWAYVNILKPSLDSILEVVKSHWAARWPDHKVLPFNLKNVDGWIFFLAPWKQLLFVLALTFTTCIHQVYSFHVFALRRLVKIIWDEGNIPHDNVSVAGTTYSLCFPRNENSLSQLLASFVGRKSIELQPFTAYIPLPKQNMLRTSSCKLKLFRRVEPNAVHFEYVFILTWFDVLLVKLGLPDLHWSNCFVLVVPVPERHLLTLAWTPILGSHHSWNWHDVSAIRAHIYRTNAFRVGVENCFERYAFESVPNYEHRFLAGISSDKDIAGCAESCASDHVAMSL